MLHRKFCAFRFLFSAISCIFGFTNLKMIKISNYFPQFSDFFLKIIGIIGRVGAGRA